MQRHKGFAKQWTEHYKEQVRQHITELGVMPSMRTLMTAGPALEKDNAAGFNCSYRAVDSVNAFAEIMYVLMCGTGAGFSVERKAVDKLPEVAEEFCDVETRIVVKDSKLGWCGALKQLLHLLWAGQVPTIDYSRIRPAGAPLKIFGGRASGPEPLRQLFDFVTQLLRGAAGRQLTSIECHEIVCKIAQVVVVGGVRRSALIGLSDITDQWIRDCKSGNWWQTKEHLSLSNNSAVYKQKPSIELFLDEWTALIRSGSGERGIFSRVAAQKKFEEIGRDFNHCYFIGTNPCGEILLRSGQFCNLSEIVGRPTDAFGELRDKAEIAALLGTLQSTLTDFRFLGKQWKDNTEEENLLGVSITGIWDCPLLNGTEDGLEDRLAELREHVWERHKYFADKLGVSYSKAITTVKPSGTVSQLVDSGSGIHPRHARYYIRRVRGDKKDPLSQFLIDQGVPHEEDVYNNQAWVFSFPIKAADDAITRDDVDPLRHLELWSIYREHWTDHNPSVTITVPENDWLAVGNWVYQNFDKVAGLSFLPEDLGTYQQPPYEAVDALTYHHWAEKMPVLDWTKLADYEGDGDETAGAQELACTGGACAI